MPGMSHDLNVTRRTVLAVGAGGAVAFAAAACSTGSSSSGGRPSRQPADKTLTSLDRITVGQAISVTLPNGQPGIVARPNADSAVCFSAICTHEGCTVAPQGARLVCPCHHSEYNALTGAVLQGPAPRPLPKVDVTVTNGQVITA